VSLTDPGLYAERAQAALGHRYRLDRLVAASRERVLFHAYDLTLKRRVSLRVNFYPDSALRGWFLREAEALAQLDHPAIRHVYDAGIVGDNTFNLRPVTVTTYDSACTHSHTPSTAARP